MAHTSALPSGMDEDKIALAEHLQHFTPEIILRVSVFVGAAAAAAAGSCTCAATDGSNRGVLLPCPCWKGGLYE